jgi:predicted alpha/beta-hydrolase family hydrolase
LSDASVAVDSPDDPRAVLVLAHGAGGDSTDPLLRALALDLKAQNLETVRFDFPYRQQGRRAPGSQTQSEDAYRQVADSVRREGLPMFLGGKSYGGRIASHIVSDGYAADGLIFLSYPLHPPGKPERLRDAHLRTITIPMLFCQGTKDPFAQPALLDDVIASLPSAVHHPIEGGDHSLRVRGRSQPDVVAELIEAITAFMS